MSRNSLDNESRPQSSIVYRVYTSHHPQIPLDIILSHSSHPTEHGDAIFIQDGVFLSAQSGAETAFITKEGT